MVEAGTVRRLLETIEQRLHRLIQARGISVEEYVADPDLQDIVERNLEVCIQACIDLGLHMLADFPGPLPETNRGVFRGLERHEVIDQHLAERLERMAGFRNLLAHAYTDLVEERVLATLDELDDVRDFAQAVLASLGDSYPPVADS